MSVITLVGAAFSNKSEVIKEVSATSGYRTVDVNEITALAGKSSGMSEAKIMAAFSAKTSVFNRFTHEKERSIAHLRLALAHILKDDQLLITGPVSFLIPEKITHILRVCLVAEIKYRLTEAMQRQGLSEKAALQHIRQQDEDLAALLKMLDRGEDPWASTLYDIVVPMDKTSVVDAAALIIDKAKSDVVARTPHSLHILDDFLLAAQVEVKLAQEGHNVGVDAHKGQITLTINKNVLMLSRLEEELKSIVEKVPGVTGAATRIGENFYQPDIYRRYDFEVPSKVLLVDDERDFVQTLSERLIMRDMGSAVAYDGESALTMIQDEEPEVMILDLKMPGIDGIEVLRQVKATNPDIEVIVLTGHGTDKDKDICMELGAFAFLQKPVDIQLLSQTLIKANEKVHSKKTRG
ncbi:response regulator [Desulfoprunum benzoelyticum]|uniref:CheY-like chemotaxis protein/cytidylate kinase n=1 Tax=Desulfoprunum benzoelyticum TaxID=1506996 RepID=A0A840UT57_9BACT|nr:response regulator [Desulfoprunum benzoelyticum]MBB5348855.1 CheY-like chemotaxis protein/cytidylate kinase [Desulfoprunum benzoelyticum]MBM9530095.1 response regulator [Desulfoprunum benzoelyticum]